ncbi:hypothetical protein KR093_003898 [Drosophila rubida]|uniref:Uncharacterized protein n=1 Tax=Drosophila rubida TaxID=30044 RepID=A0AAD4K4Z2_9MUSC|nr:hypothetical protein KR093_003898 [Drosophila rubida]
MQPSPPDDPPSHVRPYCGLGSHYLREPHMTIDDPQMVNFAKYLNPDLRRTTLICGSCFETLLMIYKVKMRHATKLRKGKKRIEAQTNSISDVSSSQHQSQNSAVSPPSTPSQSSQEFNRMQTSQAAKRRREESQPEKTPSGGRGIDDDDDSMLSLNAVNGTRLPHIQPIPKRRQVEHLNKTSMDIYLAGTTGG